MTEALTHLDPPELHQWLTTGREVVLVDVRTPAEVARGAIPGAHPIPLHELTRARALDKDQPVVFYCQSGGRSQQACIVLQRQGHKKVYNLRGGILAWQRHGLPVAAVTS